MCHSAVIIHVNHVNHPQHRQRQRCWQQTRPFTAFPVEVSRDLLYPWWDILRCLFPSIFTFMLYIPQASHLRQKLPPSNNCPKANACAVRTIAASHVLQRSCAIPARLFVTVPSSPLGRASPREMTSVRKQGQHGLGCWEVHHLSARIASIYFHSYFHLLKF